MKIDLDIYSYEEYLSDTNINHLQNWILSLKEEQYFSSAIWGAVFLEGFLSEFVKQIGLRKEVYKDLHDYIHEVSQFSGNNDYQKVPQEIINTFHKIRATRNGLVHHTGYIKETIYSDALSIYESLKTILNWYKKHYEPRYKQVFPDSEGNLLEAVPVFVSTISPDSEFQKHFLQTFNNKLRRIGIKPVRAVMKDYHKKDPIGKIVQVVKECEGMIVLGLERSHAFFLRDRTGSEKQKDKMHTKYSSGWLHLEAGVASALEKDIFVLCQEDIHSDGIFDRDWYSYPVVPFSIKNLQISDITKLLDEDPRLDDFFQHLEEWAQEKRNQS